MNKTFVGKWLERKRRPTEKEKAPPKPRLSVPEFLKNMERGEHKNAAGD